jgi:hypothetical protein
MIVVAAGVVVIAAFLGTIFVLNWLEGPRLVEPLLGKIFAKVGSARVSTPALQHDTVFQFNGTGFIRIVGSSSLQCLTQKCNLSATIEFGSTDAAAIGEVIVGQSSAEGGGWHLLWVPGQLIIQPQGGGVQITAPFTPAVNHPYAIQITNDDQKIAMSIDGNIVGMIAGQSPFVDVAHDVTVGGRDGAQMNPFVGKISGLRISVPG